MSGIDGCVGTIVHFDGWAYTLKPADALAAIDVGLICINPWEIKSKQKWVQDSKIIKAYYEQKCLAKERIK